MIIVNHYIPSSLDTGGLLSNYLLLSTAPV